jgi:prepilin peptidase CpaA
MAITAVSLLLLIAFIADMRTQRIPNGLNLSFFCGALLFYVSYEGVGGLKASLIGAAAGFIPLLLLYCAKGIGAGDVKLFGAAGAWLGMLPVLQLMLYSFLYAGALAALLLLARKMKLFRNISKRSWMENAPWLKEGKSFPFMLAVAPAAVTFLWMVVF